MFPQVIHVYVARHVGSAADDEVPRPRDRSIGEQPRSAARCRAQSRSVAAPEREPAPADRGADRGTERIEPDNGRLRLCRHAEQIEPGGPGYFTAAPREPPAIGCGATGLSFARPVPAMDCTRETRSRSNSSRIAIRRAASARAQNGKVEAFPHHIRSFLDGADLPLHRGMQRREIRQPRREPQRGNRPSWPRSPASAWLPRARSRTASQAVASCANVASTARSHASPSAVTAVRV